MIGLDMAGVDRCSAECFLWVRRVVLRIGAFRSGRYGILRSVVMGHVALRIGSLRFGR